jgi:hypothetical protein
MGKCPLRWRGADTGPLPADLTQRVWFERLFFRKASTRSIREG